MMELNSPWLRLSVAPEEGKFSLFDQSREYAWLQNARFGIRLAKGRTTQEYWARDLKLVCCQHDPLWNCAQGDLESVTLTYTTTTGEISFQVQLGLLTDQPLMLQRCFLTNNGMNTLFPERLIFCELSAGQVRLSPGADLDPVFYSNGWQSWSPSCSYRLGERQQRSRLGILTEPMINDPGTPITRETNHFASNMFALLGNIRSRTGLVAGFLSQKEQFGSLETWFQPQPSLKVWANQDGAELRPEKSLQTDWLAYGFTNLDSPNPFAVFHQAVRLENTCRVPDVVPVGWCSWYYYFQGITDQNIRENLAKVIELRSSLPLDLFQIDDGFQKSVGEWFEFNQKFPQGLQPLATGIRSAGLVPGVWLAPYIVQSGSGLLKAHPDWLLRNERGRPVTGGFGWNNFSRALDLTHPEALAFTRAVIQTAVQEWGFSYLKLDFLYAGALAGRHHDPTRTRAQILRAGLESIREEAGPDVTLLGCGCPLGSALGIVDLMRISADVGPTWFPAFAGISRPFRAEPNMPCASNAIRNILTRSHLDRQWWGNDPDCLLVRPDSQLSLPEVRSLATVIGMTGGALLISDDLTHLPAERLRISQALVPVLPENPVVVDLFDRSLPTILIRTLENPSGPYQLVALFNWEEHPTDLAFPFAELGTDPSPNWLAREFWTGKVFSLTSETILRDVPAHGVVLLAVRSKTETPLYLGSELHFSQGAELKTFEIHPKGVRFSLDLGRHCQGTCQLWLPRPPTSVLQEGLPIPWHWTEDHLLELSLALTGLSVIDIHWD